MREQFRVDLRGIVDILSHHMYSSEQVYVRELLQNARDAVEARTRQDPQHQGRIEIIPAAGGKPMVIRDNGVGLTDEEMRRLLATIGSSSKRDDFAAARRKFLGQFGIGLLSCFLVADTIDVRSRSAAQPDSPTIRWVGHADGTFEIVESDVHLDGPGTEVHVMPRHGDHQWCSEETLRELVARYAELLDVPVTIAGDVLSQRTAPWALSTEEQLEWCSTHLGFEAMGIIPLDASLMNVRGLGFVLPYTAQPGYRTGDRIYSNGMLVADAHTQVIPDWAFFCRAVIDAGDLPLTASREALLESTSTELVRKQLGSRLLSELILVLGAHPDVFQDIVRLHAAGLKSLATYGRDMRDLLRSTLLFDTTRGPMTIEQLVERGDEIGYVSDPSTYGALKDVASHAGVLIVDASGPHDTELLEVMNEDEQRSVFTLYDRNTVMTLATPDPYDDREVAERVQQRAEQALQAERARVELVYLQPAERPVLWWPNSSDGVSRTKRPTLLLNANCPAIKQMVDNTENHDLETAMPALYALALLLGRSELSLEQVARLQGSLESLIVRSS